MTLDILDELFGLYIAHTMHTGDTVTIPSCELLGIRGCSNGVYQKPTLRRAHGPSRQARPLPGHLEFSQQEAKRLQLGKPLRRHSFSFVVVWRRKLWGWFSVEVRFRQY